MNRYIFIILIFTLKAIPGWAQLDPNKLSHFPELDGSMIHDIITDRTGVLWIATQSGLIKFDGYEYIRFHPDTEDSTTMGTILTFQLYEDPKRNIWVGCMDAVYKYNPITQTFKRYLFYDLVSVQELSQPAAFSISPDNQSRIYFGITSFVGSEINNAMVYYDYELDELKPFDFSDTLELKNVYSITTDLEDNIWGMSDSGIFKIDTNHNLSYPQIHYKLDSTKDEFVNGIECDSNGLIWQTTSDAILYLYDYKTNKFDTWSFRHLIDDTNPLGYLINIEIDQDQNIWLSSHQGLIFFDKQKEQFEDFDDRNTDRLKSDFINALYIDSFNNLWIGSQSVGLLKYNDKALLQSVVHGVDNDKGFTRGWATRIFEEENGEVWIVSPFGMNLINPKTGLHTPFPASTIDPNLFSFDAVTQLNPGEIFLNSHLGRIVFNTETRSIKPYSIADINDSITIHDILQDSYRNTWYATDNGLYLKNDKSSQVHHFNLSAREGSASTSNMVIKLVESENYGLWIQSNYGLFLYNYETKQIERHAYDQEESDVLSSQDINSLYEDESGIVWLGTWQGGLCKYNPNTGSVKNYSVNDGLPSTSIQGILGDVKNNALWLSTFAGISRFNISEEQFNNYSQADGIQGLLYTDGSYLKSSSGIIFFGGNNGVTYFNPDEISQSSHPPKVYISDFKVADESVSLSQNKIKQTSTVETIELNHNQNNVSFEYVGIQYDNPAKNRFSYILENYDLSWRKVGNLRSAFYYNLPPGKYTFRVKAANSNGVWNEEGASLSFIINQPWWRTWWAYVIYGIILLSVIITVDRIQRQRLVRKAQQQAKEKELAQAKEIEKAYTELKATQTQLIHSEKMASLGELTAGIAHEIQNPLNFVNNFSDVSVDLIDEMNEEIEAGNTNEVKEISVDLKQNLKKISAHGKRASSIVKGMLEHSRAGDGHKEPTDINALADEYLRLAYHGLRAKDKSFNADFKTDLDGSLPKINIVPQDIGRVLLNLINNAFFAVSERSQKGEEGYKPAVSVTTFEENKKAVIKVADNGNGIPPQVLDKIFQPFFTTKPSGEGTGLGLSLSYDIITKGHGGDLKVETKENKGTEFIIVLPENK